MKIAELKRQIPITSVIEYMGGELFGWGGSTLRTRCPFHEDKNPSATTYAVDGYFFCGSAVCGVQGDIVELAKIHLSTEDTREAMQWLATAFGAQEPPEKSDRERDLL